VLKRDFVAVGAAGQTPAALSEDLAPKMTAGMEISVLDSYTETNGARVPLSSQGESTIVFRLVDAATGAPVTNLKKYLAEDAHAVIVSEDAQQFIHTHGEQHQAAGRSNIRVVPGQIGPDIEIHVEFPGPGYYKIWFQVQTAEGRVATAPYVVRVQ
jgi:Cu+-exporting ATPase